MYSKVADTELIYQLNKKDEKAFEEVYDHFHDGLYLHALRILEEDALAADAVQDTFISLWQRLGELDPQLNLANWLYYCIRNQCIDQIRKEKTRKAHLDRLDTFQDKLTYCDKKVLLEELNKLIDAEVAQLPNKTRRVFELSRKGGLNTREIAKVTTSSLNTVQRQLKSAINQLRKRLPFPVILTLFFCLILQKFRN